MFNVPSSKETIRSNFKYRRLIFTFKICCLVIDHFTFSNLKVTLTFSSQLESKSVVINILYSRTDTISIQLNLFLYNNLKTRHNFVCVTSEQIENNFHAQNC